jgi:hypothetical protein
MVIIAAYDAEQGRWAAVLPLTECQGVPRLQACVCNAPHEGLLTARERDS